LKVRHPEIKENKRAESRRDKHFYKPFENGRSTGFSTTRKAGYSKWFKRHFHHIARRIIRSRIADLVRRTPNPNPGPPMTRRAKKEIGIGDVAVHLVQERDGSIAAACAAPSIRRGRRKR